MECRRSTKLTGGQDSCWLSNRFPSVVKVQTLANTIDRTESREGLGLPRQGKGKLFQLSVASMSNLGRIVFPHKDQVSSVVPLSKFLQPLLPKSQVLSIRCTSRSKEQLIS